MPKQIKYGKNTLLNHEQFKRMITRHLEVMREHCAVYPLLDKERKVTITLTLKPIVNQQAMQKGIIEYDRAKFSASVGSPTLPSTSVDFNCVVVNGQPYFNLEDGENPLQLTFRDTEIEDEEVPVTPDGKSAAVKG